MLMDEYLVAVISLPAGVFNPYSGVKTSILILDKALAKRSSDIAFVKVENDGYGLGAQRREIEKNDLPAAADFLKAWFQSSLSTSSTPSTPPTPNALIVAKAKIAANGDYNLSGQRYRENAPARFSDYAFRKLGELCKIRTGKKDVNSGNENGKYPFFTCARQHTYSDEYSFDAEAILIAGNGDVGSVLYYSGKFEAYQRTYVLSDWNGVEGRYLYFLLSDRLKETVAKLKLGNTMPYIKLGMLTHFEIPLPPLDVQKEIVAEIEGYQKIIDGARAVLDNYRPHIPINPDWPKVPIKDVAAVESGFGFPLDYQGKTDEEIPFLKVSDMNLPGNEKAIVSWNHSVSRKALRDLKGEAYPKGTVIFPKIGAAIGTNKKRILTRDSTYDNNVMGIVPDTKRLLPDFLHTYLLAFDLSKWASESQPPSMRKTTVEAHEIPLPPLATQRAIVAEIEAEQKLVGANRELIGRMEKKIQAVLARVWGENKAAPEER